MTFYEVYARRIGDDLWAWIATFATRDLAQTYVQFNRATDSTPALFEFEVRPV